MAHKRTCPLVSGPCPFCDTFDLVAGGLERSVSCSIRNAMMAVPHEQPKRPAQRRRQRCPELKQDLGHFHLTGLHCHLRRQSFGMLLVLCRLLEKIVAPWSCKTTSLASTSVSSREGSLNTCPCHPKPDRKQSRHPLQSPQADHQRSAAATAREIHRGSRVQELPSKEHKGKLLPSSSALLSGLLFCPVLIPAYAYAIRCFGHGTGCSDSNAAARRRPISPSPKANCSARRGVTGGLPQAREEGASRLPHARPGFNSFADDKHFLRTKTSSGIATSRFRLAT